MGTDVNSLTSWPSMIRSQIIKCCGQQLSIEQLYGLSHNQIWRVDGEYQSVIVKVTQSTEAHFYQSNPFHTLCH